MTFTSIEIIALIFSIALLIKVLIVIIAPKGWAGVVRSLYKNPFVLMIFELILAAIVFYYLIQSFTIIEITACLVLGVLLTGMVFAAYAKELIPVAQKMLKNKSVWKNLWLPILIWLILAVWVLAELF